MTNDELPLAIYYAELGSPTKGRGAVGLAVAQARAEERAKVLSEKEQIRIEAIKRFGYSADTSSLVEFLFQALKLEQEVKK